MKTRTFYSRFVNIIFDRGLLKGAWLLTVLVGTHRSWKGAGYIGGATFYLGNKTQGRYPNGTVNYRPSKFVFGFTRNGNAVPWLTH